MGSINRVPALIGWGKSGNVTFAGWQVTLRDPIWHTSSRSGAVLVALSAIRFFIFLYEPRPDVVTSCNSKGSDSPHHRCARIVQLYSLDGAQLYPQSNTQFLRPTQINSPNGISIGSAIFARLTLMTNTQTDRQTDRCIRRNNRHLALVLCAGGNRYTNEWPCPTETPGHGRYFLPISCTFRASAIWKCPPVAVAVDNDKGKSQKRTREIGCQNVEPLNLRGPGSVEKSQH